MRKQTNRSVKKNLVKSGRSKCYAAKILQDKAFKKLI
jgi:hypothetical protein